MNMWRLLLSIFLSLTVLQSIGLAEPRSTALHSLPAVACYFDSSVKRQGKDVPGESEEWYFWREPGQIETRTTTGETSEVWQQRQEGSIFHQLVFHKDHLVIDYAPDELRAAGYAPEWSEITSLIAPDLLKTQLQETGTMKILGRQARRYQGRINETVLEVWWLEAEHLPALVRQVYPDGEVTLRLREIYPVDQSPWLRSQMTHYAHLDFADLDESEPASRAFQNAGTFVSAVAR